MPIEPSSIPAQIDPPCAAARHECAAAGAGRRRTRRVSKKGAVPTVVAEPAQAGREQRGQHVHALGDRAQPVGAVVDGIHGGHDGQQHLGGADVAGGLLAADVLLAGLQREAIGRAALGVVGDADHAAGHVALERVARGEEGGVRSAVAQRHAEALRDADGDVGAELARRREQRRGQQVGRHDDQRAGGMRALRSSRA